MTALAVILLWAAYLVRDVLLLLYVSGAARDRLQPDRPPDRAAAGCCRSARGASRAGSRSSSSTSRSSARSRSVVAARLPAARRPGAASSGREGPEMFEQAQQFLIAKGLLQRAPHACSEAVERAPGAGGSDAVGARCLGAVVGVAGGIFGLADDPDPDLLPAGRGRDACASSLLQLFPRRQPRPRRRGQRATITRQGQRVARRPAAARRHHRHHLRDRPVAARHSVLLRAGADLRRSAR